MIKYTVTGFADEIDDKLEIQLDECKKLGVKYIEMRCVNGKSVVEYSLDEVRGFKKILDQYGIKVSAIGSPIGKIKITDDFEPHFQKFLHTLDICKILETNHIRLFSFFIEKDEDPAKYRDEVIRRMKRFAEAAEKTDVILLHENEKAIYGDIPERCADVIKSVNSDHLRAIFDPANFVQCKAETVSAVKLMRPYIEYMHIKDSRYSDNVVVPCGEGDAKVYQVLTEMFKTGYSGFVSLEPHLNNGEISVCGPEKWELAFNSMNKILARINSEI